MIETVIQDHTDALNRNTSAVLALAAALSAQPAAPAKRSRAKAEPTAEVDVPPVDPVNPDPEPQPEPAETPTPEVPATVEPEPEPQPEPAAEVTHDMILNIVREFRKGLDTTNYAKSKADLKVVLDRFGIEALSKADKKDLPELLTAVKAICQ